MEPTTTINPAGAPRITTPKPGDHQDRDERTSIPLEPEDARRALLQVDPHAKPLDGR